MAYNDQLAKRIREQLKLFPEEFTEKKMFGGLTFLYKGKMTVGIVKEELVVRIVSDKMEVELLKAEVRPMDFTKRPMKEFIYVSPEGFNSEEQLLEYIEMGLEHAKSKIQ
ncbi:MAG: TfoX/Sxy family protein [Bacteroidia bacterium]|nr:TfoX/Sxy family protein [Bacteroidia bacterium]MBT8308783.1 TfoX/Sxy family protein [Bacteroidia bacterium]NND10893.1 TfoX/Sxy family protein [Flavobacteriaceae bacterium]NNL61552.1 TfoX/Sxy family protein [Flavobacteriaceae bacterium]RZV63171.1 MAG: TfoX family protein [Flavobacteriaceae bacterium]